ncbi:MAG: hypothetical protein N3A66_02270, partial [Planctomycetota bacterium]|nr:hypothetical protein [Planctomycetota bacterium]
MISKNRSRNLVAPTTVALFLAAAVAGAELPWQEIPAQQWRGKTRAEVPALKKSAAVAVAYPPKDASVLTCTTAEALPPGQYEVRLIFRPSHAAGNGIISFRSGVRLKVGEETIAEFPSHFFCQPHEAETRQALFCHPKSAPIALTIECFADAATCEKAFVAAHLKEGGPRMSDDIENLGNKESPEAEDLETALTPDKSVYCALESLALRPLSRSGVVKSVAIDKIRYTPGETLKGTAVLADLSGKAGEGMLNLYFEHFLQERTKVKGLPVRWQRSTQEVTFELPLPQKELGYALIAEYVS